MGQSGFASSIVYVYSFNLYTLMLEYGEKRLFYVTTNILER